RRLRIVTRRTRRATSLAPRGHKMSARAVKTRRGPSRAAGASAYALLRSGSAAGVAGLGGEGGRVRGGRGGGLALGLRAVGLTTGLPRAVLRLEGVLRRAGDAGLQLGDPRHAGVAGELEVARRVEDE